MFLRSFIEDVSLLSKPGKNFKPHKYLALLAVVDLIESGHVKTPAVYFDDAFKAVFATYLKQFGIGKDRNRPYTPFFHLRRHSFWSLVPNDGQQVALESVSSIGSATDLVRLVNHAQLDGGLYELLSQSDSRSEIKQTILTILSDGIDQRVNGARNSEIKEAQSLFVHEESAFDVIRKRVRSHQLGEMLTNLEIHDPQSNRYLEIDLVLISRFGIFVTELKHWSGRIDIQPHNWLQNGSFHKKDPHLVNNFKAKVLKGLFERQFPSYPSVYFQSVVVLTHPDVVASGQSVPTTKNHNPTFESLDKFFQYLKQQQLAGSAPLTREQCKAFAKLLNRLHVEGPPKDFVFNGYEVVERLYQYTDRAEVVARRTDRRHRKLCRLRIFFPLVNVSEAAKSEALERATNTLYAVEKIGEHPNILRVWDIPNEYNYVVEGSDWSETGTLQDLLQQEGCLSLERATTIAIGLLRGLQAAYKEDVVHRCVSPANVLMLDDVPKLMNFDLSYQLEDDRVTVIPDSSQLKRIAYIAPEIYAGNAWPEATMDLFSIGVILYEMLVGEKPFSCSVDLEQSGGTLTVDQCNRLAAGDVPTDLIGLICDLVQRNPNARPGSAEKVLARLDQQPEPPATLREPNRVLTENEMCRPFEIARFIRDGAESQLYFAFGMERKKILLKVFDVDVPRGRVVNEHRCSGAVQHTSLVRVDNYGQWDDGRYYIAFEWVEGHSLRDLIDLNERPSQQVFCSIASQLLDALILLHTHRDADDDSGDAIVHNDVKPDNIMLTKANRPVIVDFGAACNPAIGTYEGTDGYVAPDLKLGEERNFCPEGDLYALAVTLFEWLTGERPVADAEESDSVEGLADLTAAQTLWLFKGFRCDAAERYPSAIEMKAALLQASKPQDSDVDTLPKRLRVDGPEREIEVRIAPTLVDEISSETVETPQSIASAGSEIVSDSVSTRNPFVDYLNTMHNCSAQTDNALAENQSLNPFFSYIQVSHPLIDRIHQTLVGEQRRHVVVTGHAGDGKSTIALELFKRLTGRPNDEPLDEPLRKREEFEVEGNRIVLIKDFSELSQQSSERESVLTEMVEPDGPRFFLISNTGILLETFKQYQRSRGDNWIATESDLLVAMEQAEPKELLFRDTALEMVNIAMIDNLGVAEEIFRRMLAPERWTTCGLSDCQNRCPIYRNVQLIQANLETVIERIFWAYRRVHEYGTRLTLRQLTAHLAYMITSGLNYDQIQVMSEKATPPRLSEFMFFNRFFGDDGQKLDPAAQQIHAIRIMREQEFGSRPNALWERKLWLQTRDDSFKLDCEQSPSDFDRLVEVGASASNDGIAPAAAREQVRRAVFFLDQLAGEPGEQFIASFLKSVMLCDFVRWQKQSGTLLGLTEQSSLQKRILHVLQEHFTGVRVPEGSEADQALYVTLCRRSREIRQSAQVVLAKASYDDFDVQLKHLGGIEAQKPRKLVLSSNRYHALELSLGLPFLDYVMMRNQGQMGQDLQASYVDRMERFKGQLIALASSVEKEEIMLVRLRTNHTFRRQIFAVREDCLEVTDV